MFGFKRKLHAKRCLWICVLLVLGFVQCNGAQNASTVVWEPSSGNTSKREISSNNVLDYAGTSIAKSYDPPPEFYRGPGSSSSSSSTYSSSSGSGFVGSTGISGSGGTQLGSVGEGLSEAYNKWRNGAGLQHRISVGHYGGGGGEGGGGLGSGAIATHNIPSTHSTVSYAYEGHPYEYAGAGGGAHHGGGYYSGNSAENGIPFDVYGARPGHGAHHSHYGGTGNEYAYVEPHDIAASHKGQSELSHKALLAKSFLIPLASAAVLGIAAALVSNPLLLQLGTVSGVGGALGPVVGKRKRRALRRAYGAHK